MKKLLITPILIAVLSLSGVVGTAYATGDHSNNNHNNGHHGRKDCKPSDNEEVVLSVYVADENDQKENHGHHNGHNKHKCKDKEPCQYNQELKTSDKECVPPVEEPEPTPTPTPTPEPTPIPEPETPAVQTPSITTTTVVDDIVSTNFQGK